jgi:hypothetical protein
MSIKALAGVDFPEQSSGPGNPASGYGRLYVKNDGTLHFINDSGIDMDLSIGHAPYQRDMQSGRYYYLPNILGSTTLATLGNQNCRAAPFWVPNPITISRIGSEISSAGDAGRTFADGGTTNASATLTSTALASFTTTDVGRKVTGTGIPTDTYIVSRQSATSVTMSKNATATGSALSVTISGCVLRIGIHNDDGTGRPGTLLLDAGTIDGASATVQEITISQALDRGVYYVSAAVQGVTTTQPTVRCHNNQGLLPGVDAGTSIPLTTLNSASGYQQTGVGSAFGTFTVGSVIAVVPRIFAKVA